MNKQVDLEDYLADDGATELVQVSGTEKYRAYKLSPRPPISVGDLVTLKSGGPVMTVAERMTDKARCLWHQDDGGLHDYWLPLAALKVR